MTIWGMPKPKFILFLTASGYYGLGSALLTGAFLVVGIGEHHKGENLSSFWFMCLAGVCLLFGCYLAWNAEHEKLLKEIARNANPIFAVEMERLVYSDNNAHLFILCSIVNLSEKKAGLRSALLSDSRVSETKPADEAFRSASLFNPDQRRIAISENEHGRVTAETIGVSHVDNLLKTSSPLLTQGVREVGWFAFAGVTDPKDVLPNTFDLQVKDTLGGIHRAVAVTTQIERRQIFNAQ